MNGQKYRFTAPLMVVFATFLLLTGTAEARIDTSRIGVGALTPSTSVGYMKEVYGEPGEVTHKPFFNNLTRATYHYGSTVTVNAIFGEGEEARAKTRSATVTANNGWATPDGVRVGMRKEVLENTYGPADSVQSEEGGTVCNYTDEYGVRALSFLVKNGVICAISYATEI